MALFDGVIREISDTFGIGPKAGPLVAELLKAMGESRTGGLAAFLERFKAAGLGDHVASWIGHGENRPLTDAEMDQALGPQFLSDIGNAVGIAAGNIGPAVAFAIPKLVHLLTPQGVVPLVLPPDARTLIDHPTASAAAFEQTGERRSLLGRIWPFLALLLLGFVAWLIVREPEERFPAPSTRAPAALAPVEAPQALVKPSFSLINRNGVAIFSGLVRDDASRATILDALKATFGEGNIKGNIAFDPGVAPAGWLAGFGEVMAALKVPGLEALFEGDQLYIGGAASDASLATVRDRLKALLPGLQVASLEDRATAAVRSASERTLAALKALVPGFAASDLAGALNLSVINFASNSAEVPADSRPLLQEAAAAIKAAPAGTLIEIAGHTDSTADAATNLPLSQARAEAVRAVLVEFGAPADRLTAKGYGDTQPVATNDTPDGRFQNRRIEYRVIR